MAPPRQSGVGPPRRLVLRWGVVHLTRTSEAATAKRAAAAQGTRRRVVPVPCAGKEGEAPLSPRRRLLDPLASERPPKTSKTPGRYAGDIGESGAHPSTSGARVLTRNFPPARIYSVSEEFSLFNFNSPNQLTNTIQNLSPRTPTNCCLIEKYFPELFVYSFPSLLRKTVQVTFDQ